MLNNMSLWPAGCDEAGNQDSNGHSIFQIVCMGEKLVILWNSNSFIEKSEVLTQTLKSAVIHWLKSKASQYC